MSHAPGSGDLLFAGRRKRTIRKLKMHPMQKPLPSFFILVFSILGSLAVQGADTLAVYPANWWVGMKNPDLQLMLRGKDLVTSTTFTVLYPGVELLKVRKADNPHYAFLDLRISPSA